MDMDNFLLAVIGAAHAAWHLRWLLIFLVGGAVLIHWAARRAEDAEDARS